MNYFFRFLTTTLCQDTEEGENGGNEGDIGDTDEPISQRFWALVQRILCALNLM